MEDLDRDLVQDLVRSYLNKNMNKILPRLWIYIPTRSWEDLAKFLISS